MSARANRRGAGVFVLVVIALAVAALVMLPTGLGRLMGELWVTVMGAIVGLLGGAVGH
ncbi:hypothetical protein [Terricaulis sp.]|uniref:hypothetical protein n=1 Tax=Terricaulis sp. TaxID=2768686 RepID=UPI003784283C